VSATLLPWLLRTSVVLTALIVLILLLRPILRRFFGARVAYASWLLLLPAVLPRLPMPGALDRISPAAGLPALAPETYVVTAGLTTGFDAAFGLALLWLAGALVTLSVFWWRQRRFVGTLRLGTEGMADDRARLHKLGLARWVPVRSSPAIASPMVVGCLPPRLVLPSDDCQAEDILAHEIAHVRHGDPVWSGLFTGMRSLFWFLPWLHLAWKAFRLDQELAADEAVLSQLDRSRRYRYATLLVQSAGIDRPVTGQAWFDHSQLKERVRMINNISHSTSPLKTGLVLITGLLLASTWALAVPPSKGPENPTSPPRVTPERMAQIESEQFSPVDSEQVAESGSEQVAEMERLANSEPLTGDQIRPVVRVNPLYPRQAAMDGTTGQVVLEAVVTPQGDVTAINVVEAEPEGVFEAVAVEAFSHWKFEPIVAAETGQPESRKIRQVIEFLMDS
jgi:TonB family protein